MELKKCEHCPKVIEGYTENQVNYLMEQHMMARHRDRMEEKGGCDRDAN